jgi:U3 small nucleolar RNA-associated protein 18
MPAWTDSDDTTLQLSLTSDKRLKKLRSAPSDDVVGGREYELRLRRQFERINPAPSWVSAARRKLHPARKRRRLSDSPVSADDEEDVVLDLFSSTNGIVHRPENSTLLQQGALSIERLHDANQSAKTDGRVQAVQFHPSPQVPVLLTAGSDRRLRLFNVSSRFCHLWCCCNTHPFRLKIDGLTNPHLQTLHVPTLPITNALFHPSGSSILATGPRPCYFSHDLQSGASHLSPRGLWGTTFNRTNSASQEMSMEKCAFSRNGEVLAVAGRHGYVHLVDWKSGTGQVVGSLKMNADVKSLWWPPGISGESRHLMSLSADSEVYVWDIGERMCVRRWRDDGGFGSVLMSGDSAGGYLAIG